MHEHLRFAPAMSVGVTATEAHEMADQLAISYSKAALSVFSKSIVRSPGPHARFRTSILVARVPAALLYALLAADLAFVVADLILCFCALYDPEPGEARNVYCKLSSPFKG